MLEKETVIDKIEILEGGDVQVRRATYIVEDGVRIAGPIYQRQAYEPAESAPVNETPLVKDVAAMVWTPEVIATREARKQAQASRLRNQIG